MNEFNKLQDLWKQQEQKPLPNVSEIIDKAKKEKSRFANKILLQVATLTAAILGILWVVLVVAFQETTTFIGIALMLLCVIVFTVIRLHQMLWLKRINFTATPSKTLMELEKFYTFQQFVGTKLTLCYFILMNIAFGFYFIEVMAPMSDTLKIIVLIAYIAWMLFAYFYLGKKQQAKENARTQKMIDAIKTMEANYDK